MSESTPDSTVSQESAPESFLAALSRYFGELRVPDPLFTLHVIDPTRERLIYFARGGVRIIGGGDRPLPSIPNVMLQRGMIQPGQLHRLRERQVGGGDLREVLAEERILARDDYDDFLNGLIRAELMSLVFWKDAACCFQAAPPPTDAFRRDLNTLSAAIDGPRLADDLQSWIELWQRAEPILHGARATLTLTPQGESHLESTEPAAIVLRWCTTCPELRTLLRVSDLPLPDLCRHVVKCVSHGWITVTPPPAADRTRSHIESIAALEARLETSLVKDPLREELVQLYQATKQTDKAVKHLRVLAEAALERYSRETAYEYWNEILRIAPENVDVFAKVVEVLAQQRREADIVRLAERQARDLLKQPGGGAAYDLAKVLRAIPCTRHIADDIQDHLYTKKTQRRRALDRVVTQFEEEAEKLRSAGNPGAACQILRKALSHDPDCARVKEKLRQFELEERPRSPLRHVVLCASALLAVALIVGAFHTTGVSSFPKFADAAANFESPSPLSVEESREEQPANPAKPGEDRPAVVVGESDTADPARRLSSPNLPAADRVPLPRRAGIASHSLRCRAHDGRHDVERYLLSRRHEAFSAASCDLLIHDRFSEEVVCQLEGEPGFHWSIGARGNVLAQWQAGEAVRLYRGWSTRPRSTAWSLPDDTFALALSGKYIAVCRPEETILYDHDGTVVKRASLPRWRQGVLTHDTLIVEGIEPRRSTLLVVHPESLQVLWSVSPSRP